MNVYYDPEKFGLEVVAEHDFSPGSYEFDLRVVWRREHDGALLTARDGGCSCPTQFEDYGLGGDRKLEPLVLADLQDEFREETKNSYRNLQGWPEFFAKVTAAYEARPR
jgi:hypothetical protein